MSAGPITNPVVVFCHPITFGNPEGFDVRPTTHSYVTKKIDVNDDELPSWQDQLAVCRTDPDVEFFLSADFNPEWVEHALKNQHGVIILLTKLDLEKVPDVYRQEVQAYYRAIRTLQTQFFHRRRVVLGEITTSPISIENLLTFSSVL